MKILLLSISMMTFLANAQIGYSVHVTKLMATADDCDGGGFCLSAPQDPVFNIWVTDAQANENSACFTFDNDDNMAYGVWNDIPDFELANESYVLTNYLSFDLGAFESDAFSGISCTSGTFDDNVFDRAFNKLITTGSMPMNVVYTDTLVVGGIYNMVVDILWFDYASLDEISDELSVAISPNPSSGVFKINLTDLQENEFNITVSDVSGNSIYSNFVNGTQTSIDLSSHNTGVYFVNIVSNNRSVTKRIQVQH